MLLSLSRRPFRRIHLMRRQDELTFLYPGQSLMARKFLLAEMEGLALAFDSEELLEFLQSEVAAEAPEIRDQALVSLSRFLPGFLRKRYALAAQAQGVWSAFAAGPGTAAGDGGPRDPVQARALAAAALGALQPLVQQLLAAASRLSGRDRTRAVLGLAPFGLRSTRAWLGGALASPTPDLAAALALARQRGPEAQTPVLEYVRRFRRGHPALLHLLAEVPCDGAFALLMDSIDQVDTAGRMDLARSLSAFENAPVLDAFDRLAARGEGWVVASAMASLESLTLAPGLDRIIGVFRSASHDFLRMQAVKAAGGLASSEAEAFCRDALRVGTESVKAVALESLVRLRTDPGELSRLAAPHGTSAHPRLAVNALLASLEPEEALASPSLTALLFSSAPLARLEAAYALAYFRSGDALEFLAALATEDPSPLVRAQAAKSLSRYDASQATSHLLALLEGTDKKQALTAARLLARYDGDQAGQVADRLAEHLRRRGTHRSRALSLWILAVTSVKAGRRAHVEIIASGLGERDAEVVGAAVEGLNLLGAAGDGQVAASLATVATSVSPRTRARALLGRWSAGDLDAPRLLALEVASSTADAGPALEAALELGMLLAEVVGHDRFPALADRLAARSLTRTDADFAAKEVDLGATLATPVARLRLSVDLETRGPAPKVPELPAPPAESPGRSTGRRAPGSPGRDAGQLRKFLAKQAVPARGSPDLRKQLEKVSPFVGPDTGFGALLAALASTPAGRVAIGAPVVVLVLIVVLMSSRPAAIDRPPPGFPGHLWVGVVEGAGSVAGKRAEQRKAVVDGNAVATEIGAELTLLTPRGNRVTLRPRSHLEFLGLDQGVSDAPRYRFKNPTGDVVFEFRQGAQIELVFPTSRLVSNGGTILVSRDPGPRSVTVTSGSAVLETRQGTTVMQRGDTTGVE